MDFVVLQKQFLVDVLTKVLAYFSVLNLHVVLQFVESLPDDAEALVELRLDDELVVVKSVEVYGGLNHFLKSCQTV